MNHNVSEFGAFLSLYRDLEASEFLTQDERQSVLDVAVEQFRSRAHDPRLAAIVDRLAQPKEAPVAPEEVHPAQPAPSGTREGRVARGPGRKGQRLPQD